MVWAVLERATKIRDGFSPQVIDLGRYLFFDPLLSANNSIACSSCHDPDYGFADGLGRARGINKAVLDRSAPSLWNIGFFDTLLWDGSKSSLEEQLIGPLYADNEMGNRPDQLIADLRSNAIYKTYSRSLWTRRDTTRSGVYGHNRI